MGAKNKAILRPLGAKLPGPSEEPATLYTVDVPFCENCGSGNPSQPAQIFPMAELNSVGMVNDMEVTMLSP